MLIPVLCGDCIVVHSECACRFLRLAPHQPLVPLVAMYIPTVLISWLPTFTSQNFPGQCQAEMSPRAIPRGGSLCYWQVHARESGLLNKQPRITEIDLFQVSPHPRSALLLFINILYRSYAKKT